MNAATNLENSPRGMRGFDAEFVDLPDYITRITHRIWEERQIELIQQYYSDPCVVETPASVTTTPQSVIDGTHSTLKAFPDRELLAEDIIWSGDAERGYLSSHRIVSPMTHLGEGVFGAPTGRKVRVRTIADCWCIENRISHEWLVRDQAAIAQAIGLGPESLAAAWLETRGGRWHHPVAPSAPPPYENHVDTGVVGTFAVATYRSLATGDISSAFNRCYDRAITAVTPGERYRYGVAELGEFWREYREAFADIALQIEHCIVRQDRNAPVRVAMRWRLSGVHRGGGKFGEPTGRAIETMGITHLEMRNGRISREWLLLDEVALWMQVLSA